MYHIVYYNRYGSFILIEIVFHFTFIRAPRVGFDEKNGYFIDIKQ